MNIDKLVLLSPLPIYIKDVGNIMSPTLLDISKIGENEYKTFLYMLQLTPEKYYKDVDKEAYKIYQALDDKIKLEMTIYDLIISNKEIAKQYANVLNFFFVEQVIFNEEFKQFDVYKMINNKNIKIGIITRKNFDGIIDIILQRNYVQRSIEDEDYSKVKNKKALEILKKLKKGSKAKEQSKQEIKKYSIANIVSALSAYSKAINISSIWNLTIYQLYDQFARLQNKILFNINANSVSVWGDSDNKFKFDRWYDPIDKN